MLFLKCVWEVFWHFGEPFCPRLAHCPNVWELCCLTWHALLSLPCFPPWQVELSIQRGCMTHVWTPSTAFPWLHLWTSSSCVYTEDCLQKSQILTTSGKYVSDLRPFSLQFCVCVCFNSRCSICWKLELPVRFMYFLPSFKVNEEKTAAVLAWCVAKITTSVAMHEMILPDPSQMLLRTWTRGIESTGSGPRSD